jgi:hypothetical protein
MQHQATMRQGGLPVTVTRPHYKLPANRAAQETQPAASGGKATHHAVQALA